MFGIGKKDEDGNQTRIEHKGKYIRASRTGGISARAQKKIGPVTVTANTSKGLRLSTKVAKGTRVALQNGKFQLIGRWRTGPFAFNLSKTGVSASVKSEFGTLNFLKPQYSSFRMFGIHLRGRKAANLVFIFTALKVVIWFAYTFLRGVWVAGWLSYLALAFFWDLLIGFATGFRNSDDSSEALSKNTPAQESAKETL